MRLPELETENSQELIFACDCGDRDYLRVTWDEDIEWKMLWIEARHGTHSWREKLRDCWKILTNKDLDVGEVILTEKAVERLQSFLSDRI